MYFLCNVRLVPGKAHLTSIALNSPLYINVTVKTSFIQFNNKEPFNYVLKHAHNNRKLFLIE